MLSLIPRFPVRIPQIRRQSLRMGWHNRRSRGHGERASIKSRRRASSRAFTHKFASVSQIYAGLTFRISIFFPPNYPYVPPVIKFESPCYHPNVDLAGNICLDILQVRFEKRHTFHRRLNRGMRRVGQVVRRIQRSLYLAVSAKSSWWCVIKHFLGRLLLN